MKVKLLSAVRLTGEPKKEEHVGVMATPIILMTKYLNGKYLNDQKETINLNILYDKCNESH